jgi:hypothetical protein
MTSGHRPAVLSDAPVVGPFVHAESDINLRCGIISTW